MKLVAASVLLASAMLAFHVSFVSADTIQKERYHFANLTPGASDHTAFDTPYSYLGSNWCTAITQNEMYQQYTYYNGTVALIDTSGTWRKAKTDSGGYLLVGEPYSQQYRKKSYCSNPSIVTYWANCYSWYALASGCNIT